MKTTEKNDFILAIDRRYIIFQEWIVARIWNELLSNFIWQKKNGESWQK